MHQRSLVPGAAVGALAAIYGFSALAVAGGGMPVFFDGLAHQPLGGAQLTLQGGHLTVSNIGSSGKDGVSIDVGGGTGFGQAQGLAAAVELPPPGQWPPGLVFQADWVPPLPGPEGQDQKVLCAQFQEFNGGQAQLALDLSFLNPAMVRVEAELDGQVQEVYEFVPPYPVPFLAGSIGGGTGSGMGLRLSNIGSSGKDGVTSFDVFFDVDSPLSVAGNPLVIADAVRFLFIDPDVINPPIGGLDLRAALPGQLFGFIIVNDFLELFDVPQRALGEAHLSAGGDHLTISNIGSSGKDGVRQDPLPPGTGGFLERWDNDPVAAPFVMQVSADLSLDGLPPGEPVMGTVEIPPGETASTLTVDFLALGSSSQTVELFLDGEIAFSQSGQTGPVAESAARPTAFSTDGVRHIFLWDASTPVTIPGGPTILADEVHASAEPGAQAGLPTVTEVTAAGLQVGGDESITLTDFVLLPDCPWDCANGDGQVGIEEFLAVLGTWGQADAPCDFDGDGVGITDFLKVLGLWGPCS